jgi:hypothetical protein
MRDEFLHPPSIVVPASEFTWFFICDLLQCQILEKWNCIFITEYSWIRKVSTRLAKVALETLMIYKHLSLLSMKLILLSLSSFSINPLLFQQYLSCQSSCAVSVTVMNLSVRP